MKTPLISIPIELNDTPECRGILRTLISTDLRTAEASRKAILAVVTYPFVEALREKALELEREGKL